MQDTNKDLIKSIGSDSLDLLSEYGEVVLDSTVNSEILEDIPVFGSIIKLSKIGVSIKDYLFINKVKSFLISVNNVSTKERQKFIGTYLNDEDNTLSLGEKLIHTLDKIDSTKKALYVGKAFNLYLQQIITRNDFFDLIYAIENFKIHYSTSFIKTCLNIGISNTKSEIIDHFFTCGLLFSNTKKGIRLYSTSDNKYSSERLTDLGILFLEYILEYDKEKLRLEFIGKIKNIEPRRTIFGENIKFIKSITKLDFINMIENESFNNLLNYKVFNSSISNFKKEEFDIIQRMEEDKYSLFNLVERNTQ